MLLYTVLLKEESHLLMASLIIPAGLLNEIHPKHFRESNIVLLSMLYELMNYSTDKIEEKLGNRRQLMVIRENLGNILFCY